MTQTQTNCCETHLGGGDTTAFVVPSAPIAWSTFVASSVMKAPPRFWPHSRDCCHSLTLTCQKSPCWRSYERSCKFLSSPLLAIDWAWLPRGMCVNWNQLRYLACCASRLATATYQECGCPSNYTGKLQCEYGFELSCTLQVTTMLNYVIINIALPLYHQQ